MRVVSVVPVFPQISETFIVNKVLGLLDRGVDAHIVCGSSPGTNWSAFDDTGLQQRLVGRVHVAPGLSLRPSAVVGNLKDLVAVGASSANVARRYLTDRAVPPRQRLRSLVVDAALCRLEPDVTHFEFGALAVGRMALGRHLGCAVTVSFRGSDLMYIGLEHRDHYEVVFDRADGIHVLGESLWSRAVERGARADQPHQVIPPAIDTSDIHPTPSRPGALGAHDRPLRVLSIGRLHWTKGYDDALEAIGGLRDQGTSVEYRIVGDGDLLAAVAFWRHQLGLDDRVELRRSVPPAEVARQLAWADVVLHSAVSEGFCNAVIEAQAHGVPVVCTDAGGLPENVDDGVTGIVVPRRDPAALAAALTRLAADGDLRARMGTAGRDRVERLFRLDDQIDAWVRFYQDAITRRSAVGAR